MFGYQSCGYEEQITPLYVNQLTTLLWSCREQRHGIRFYKCNLSRADLRDVNLLMCGIVKCNLHKAKYNKDTKFPDGFDPEAAGMVLRS